MPLDDNAPTPVVADSGAGAAQTTNDNLLNRQLSAVINALGDGSEAVITSLTNIASAITASIIGGSTGSTANRALVSKGTAGRALQPTVVSIDPATGDIDTNGGDIEAAAGEFTALTENGVAVATINQTGMLSFVFAFPEDGLVRLVINSAFAFTVTSTTTRTTAGTSTCTFSINGTPLGGTANSASTSEQTQAHASANAVAVGDDFEVTFSSTSGAENLTITIAATYVLA